MFVKEEMWKGKENEKKDSHSVTVLRRICGRRSSILSNFGAASIAAKCQINVKFEQVKPAKSRLSLCRFSSAKGSGSLKRRL